jgi:DNA replication protein DnaC
LKFIDRTEVVHLLGPPGTGKSHLATALAVEAVKAGKSVAFATLAEIVTALAACFGNFRTPISVIRGQRFQ